MKKAGAVALKLDHKCIFLLTTAIVSTHGSISVTGVTAGFFCSRNCWHVRHMAGR